MFAPHIGELCSQQKTCTVCPARQQCLIRPVFYSPDEYRLWETRTIDNLRFSLGLLGFNKVLVEEAISSTLEAMKARRDEELRVFGTAVADSTDNQVTPHIGL